VLTGCSGAGSDEAGAGDRDPAPTESSRTGASGGDPDTSGGENEQGAPGSRAAVPPELDLGPDEQPPAPRSPAEVVAQLRAADRVIADGSRETDPALLATAGHVQQVAYRELAGRPAWDARVLPALPRELRSVARDTVAARRAFRSMHPTDPGELATELPAWRIVEPVRLPALLRHYREAERRYGVAWEYLAAINLVETVFGRIRGTSVAGAEGPMQFIPTTWDIYGEGGDVHDPHDAIMAAARLLEANGFTEPGGRSGALRSYNNSAAYVRGVTLHAEVLQRRPDQLRGWHGWQVHYLTRRGYVWLPEGYARRTPVPVSAWLEDRAASAR
jgi:hypothetical protein